MSRSSIRYIDTTYIYGQKSSTVPVTNPVVYGKFPKHVNTESSAEKINKFLCSVLMGLVLVSIVSYYFVSDGEKRMNGLGREITVLSSENIELQNKIDNLHSFNQVDRIIHEKTMLDTAKKVIEIPSAKIAMAPVQKEKSNSFVWSFGY